MRSPSLNFPCELDFLSRRQERDPPDLTQINLNCGIVIVGSHMAFREGGCSTFQSFFLASSLVGFRGEDRLRIGPGNFAYYDPADSADECAG